MNIDQILNAESASLWSILGDRGRGFYVPLYQRRYRWTPSMIDRLLQDLLLGLERITRDPQAITFVGTIISSVKDPSEDLGKEPSGTLAVIDGQQRLTTFTLLCIACHDEIRGRADSISEEAPYAPWMRGQVELTKDYLWECIVEDTKQQSDALLRFRPRLVRAVDDRWGTSEKDAAYASPLPVLVLDYISWVNDDNGSYFVFSPEPHAEKNPDLADQYSLFQRRYRDDIRRRLRKAIDDEDEELVFPSWSDLQQRQGWTHGLFEADAPDPDIAAALLSDVNADEDLASLVRLLLFSRFLLNRVVMTLVKAQREDYALDMFDSLNTTGEPLTAIETFKPRVIQGEGGVAGYRNSVAKNHFDDIEKYLAGEGSASEADIAKSIVTTFALAETGDKLGGKLSEQRNYLRDTYSQVSGQKQLREAMTRQLERTSALSLLVWSKTPEMHDARLHGEIKLTPETRFHLDVLRRSQHEITLALLSRYFDALITSRSADDRQRFSEIVRALLSFWALWRSSTDGTRGIDSVHRDMMGRGIPPGVEEEEERLLAPMARQFSNQLPSPGSLSEVLRTILGQRRSISDLESYVEHAQSVPIGKSRNLSRFLVLAAHDGQVPDDGSPGLTKEGKGSPESATLTLEAWTSDRYSTLEHVAPQQPREDESVDNNLYVADRFELLGNLTALPLDLNASLGNRSWLHKRVAYTALCADDADSAREVLLESGLDFSTGTIDLIADESTVIPALRPLLSVENWDLDFVHERTRHALGQVWKTLAPWLGYGED